MSDERSERPLDPQLDVLLRRVLGARKLSEDQREDHYARLGIRRVAQRAATSSSTLPFELGRSSSFTFGEQEPGARRRVRHWLELGAALLAVVVVGALLTGVFDRGGDGRGQRENDDALIAQSTPPSLATTPEAEPAAERLYIVSHVYQDSGIGSSLTMTGRVSAFDPATRDQLWVVDTGARIDAGLSPDGARLFVATTEASGDVLRALDARDGRAIWSVAIEDRVWHKNPFGATSLTVSPNGKHVYIYSCSACTGLIREGDGGDHWLQVFDTVTGQQLEDIVAPTCVGPIYAAPNEITLYQMCEDASPRLIDIGSGDSSGADFLGDAPVDVSVAAPDGERVFMVANGQLTAIQTGAQAATSPIPLPPDVAPDQESWLDLAGVSPDGRYLFLGILDQAAIERDQRVQSREIVVYDTGTWAEVSRIRDAGIIDMPALAASFDNRSVYVVNNRGSSLSGGEEAATIMQVGIAREPRPVTTRPGEEVLLLFAGVPPRSTEPAEPVPAPTPAVADDGRLYALGLIYPAQSGMTIGTIGRLTAYDIATGNIRYVVDRGAGIDAALSPDGLRIYLAALNRDTGLDELSALDAETGRALWTVPLDYRVRYPSGEGPSALAVSADGHHLFVYSHLPGDDTVGTYHLQVISTEHGRAVERVELLAGCDSQLHPSANGLWLYVVCLDNRGIQVISLATMQMHHIISDASGTKVGSALSSDGSLLYVMAGYEGMYRVSVLDTATGEMLYKIDRIHQARDGLAALHLLTLSPDGLRLYLGMDLDGNEGIPSANEVWVWDTATWQERQRLPASQPINGPSLAPANDGRSVFAISNLFNSRTDEPGRGDILRIGFDGSDWFARKNSEKVIRLFTGPTPTRGTPDLAEESAALEKSAIEAERARLTPYPVPDTCAATAWSGPRPGLTAGIADGYWINGQGLMLGQQYGLLVTGDNDLSWRAGPNGLTEDTLRGPIDLIGIHTATPEVEHQLHVTVSHHDAYDFGAGIERQWMTSVEFPQPGCWTLHAEVGATTLRATVYVYPQPIDLSDFGAVRVSGAPELSGEQLQQAIDRASDHPRVRELLDSINENFVVSVAPWYDGDYLAGAVVWMTWDEPEQVEGGWLAMSWCGDSEPRYVSSPFDAAYGNARQLRVHVDLHTSTVVGIQITNPDVVLEGPVGYFEGC
jgi:outer membrane protein assembly factor BamB